MAGSFTEDSIKAIVFAQDESRRLGHRFVGTEQILLGTLSGETDLAAKILKSIGVTLENARIEVEKITGRGSDFVAVDISPFLPKVCRALDLAREETQFLLGTISKETSEAEAVKVLESVGVTLEHARIEAERMIGRGSDFVAVDIPPFSPKACRALDLAYEEAQQRGRDYIYTEHLLLGMLRIEDGIALQVLANLGVDATEIRDLVVRMLNVKGFTEKSIKVIMFAQEESRRLGHRFVGTEQILLGTLTEETSVAAKVLKSMGVTLENARIEVEKIIGRSSDFVAFEIPPFSPKASRAVDLAYEEAAQQLGSDYIDVEHLLLGTLRIEDGTALQVLVNLGVDATEIRDLVFRRLGENTEG
jgi:ATP-dependent Clp protease ATP-binding subunit ClpA